MRVRVELDHILRVQRYHDLKQAMPQTCKYTSVKVAFFMVSFETPVPTGFLDLSTGVSQLEGLLERQAELESREAELNDQVGV